MPTKRQKQVSSINLPEVPGNDTTINEMRVFVAQLYMKVKDVIALQYEWAGAMDAFLSYVEEKLKIVEDRVGVVHVEPKEFTPEEEQMIADAQVEYDANS